MTIVVYQLCFTIQVVNWVASLVTNVKNDNFNNNKQPDDDPTNDGDIYDFIGSGEQIADNVIIPDQVAFFIVNLVIYFFMFETQIIYNKFHSDTYAQFVKVQEQTNKHRAIMFIIAFFMFALEITFYVRRFIFKEWHDYENMWIQSSLIIVTFISSTEDIIVILLVLRQFNFIIRKKQENLEFLGQDSFTLVQKFTIQWSKILLLINCLDRVIRFVLSFFILKYSEESSFMFEVHQFFIYCLLNFLNAVTILRLFYVQGKHSIRRMQNTNNNNKSALFNESKSQVSKITFNKSAASITEYQNQKQNLSINRLTSEIGIFQQIKNSDEYKQSCLLIDKDSLQQQSNFQNSGGQFSDDSCSEKSQFQHYIADHMAYVRYQQENILKQQQAFAMQQKCQQQQPQSKIENQSVITDDKSNTNKQRNYLEQSFDFDNQ